MQVLSTASLKHFMDCLPTLLVIGCSLTGYDRRSPAAEPPQLIVLGIAQDGGYPQAGCNRACCQPAWQDADRRRLVSCVAVVDPASGQRWMFDCTPDFREQLRMLDTRYPSTAARPLSGILPTHAHVGHYAGLIHLGREVMGADAVPVFCMPRMRYFLETQGPWEQLVQLQQIELRRIAAGTPCQLNPQLSVTPLVVPHRDEYSETVAFRIDGPNRSVLYLPDIDKWDRWEVPITDLIGDVDLALLDATFFDGTELPGRDMTLIPHPFVAESLRLFAGLSATDRNKIHFIHLNHTNPALQADSAARRAIEAARCHVAEQGDTHPL